MNGETKTLDISSRLYNLLWVLIAIIGLLVLSQVFYNFQNLPQNTPYEIYFSGEGKAVAKPDIAMVSFGVTTQGVKSQDVTNENNTKMNAVIKAIKDLGIEDKDIKSTLYNLTPRYSYSDNYRDVERYYPYYGSGNISGYTLEQQIQVKIRDFEKINNILETATSNGANNVGSLYFTVDDIESVKSEARQDAINQAKEKAKILSEQSGIKLGKLINVSEGYNYPYAYGLGGAVAREVALDVSVAPDIQAGEQEVSVNITITYQVK